MSRTKASDAELMASIGHEFQHAVEMLSDPTVTNSHTLFFFYQRLSGDTGRFETTHRWPCLRR